MRVLFFVLFFVGLYQDSSAQSDNTIGFACGYSGNPTKMIETFSWELKAQNYQWISKQLNSESPASKYMAAIIIENLDSLGLYKATSVDQDQIAKIKHSDEEVFVCSGCTFAQNIKLKNMFSGRLFKAASYWLESEMSAE